MAHLFPSPILPPVVVGARESPGWCSILSNIISVSDKSQYRSLVRMSPNQGLAHICHQNQWTCLHNRQSLPLPGQAPKQSKYGVSKAAHTKNEVSWILRAACYRPDRSLLAKNRLCPDRYREIVAYGKKVVLQRRNRSDISLLSCDSEIPAKH